MKKLALLVYASVCRFTTNLSHGQAVGDTVTAHGLGDARSRTAAQDEAYDQLMASRASIGAALPAGLAVNWEQIRETEMEQYFGYG